MRQRHCSLGTLLGEAIRISPCLSPRSQRDIRRLLIVGAMSVVQWRARRGAPEGSWIARMLARKPRMVIAIALANKIARTIWAVLTRGEDYRSSAAVA